MLNKTVVFNFFFIEKAIREITKIKGAVHNNNCELYRFNSEKNYKNNRINESKLSYKKVRESL
jgi:hypothetical protein